MHSSIRKVLSLLTACSVAIAMLSALSAACVEMPTTRAAEGGHHDCGDGGPEAPRSTSHGECHMLAPCAAVALTTAAVPVTDGMPSRERPRGPDESRPLLLATAPETPPPRA